MTSEPPSTPDEFPPPLRQRPGVGNLSKASVEMDLWSFDEDEPAQETKPKSIAPLPERGIPAARLSEAEKLLRKNEESGLTKPASANKFLVNVKKFKGIDMSDPDAKPASTADPEFDDLDHWEVNEALEPPNEIVQDLPELPATLEVDDFISEAEEKPSTTAVTDELAAAAVSGGQASIKQTSKIPSKGALSTALRPLLAMGVMERVCLASLFAVVLLGGGSFLLVSIYSLPTESARVKANDFPIKGQNIEITNAVSYWRAPIIGGETPDIFRRGTVFLPAVKIHIGTGSAALRVVFQNQEGELIGDVQTRAVTAGQVIEIPATAGFDDAGMHAAYRTGEGKPWTIQLSEAAKVNSPASGYKKLFEMNVSTDRR